MFYRVSCKSLISVIVLSKPASSVIFFRQPKMAIFLTGLRKIQIAGSLNPAKIREEPASMELVSVGGTCERL